MKRLALLSLLGLLIVPATVRAAGGTYVVAECDSLNRDDADALLRDSAAYSTKNDCDDSGGDWSLQIGSRKPAATGHRGLIRFATPSSDLGIVGVRVDAKLRGNSGSHPRLWLADRDFNEVHRITGGDSPGDGFHHYSWSTDGPGARQFIASLTCEGDDGCEQSDIAKSWIRNVRLIVADYADPELGELGGSLLDGGWVKGSLSLDAVATDSSSGISEIIASINRQVISSKEPPCQGLAGTGLFTALVPCIDSGEISAEADTTSSPFHDGTNELRACAADPAGNQTCSTATVLVDNRPPQLSFTGSQLSGNPELIRSLAVDSGSGVASGGIAFRAVGSVSWTPLSTVSKPGRLEAYVDSTAVTPGDYEFMATATDAAGNSSSTTVRTNGQSMILSFPLKAGTRLNAHLVPGGERRETVAYGRTSKVAGRLLNASGKPISREKVRVVEHFAPGALISRRVRVLHTDRGGFFGERIPAGPSRTITASYAGSKRYLNDGARAGRLVVRSKAGLHTSKRRVKEGRSVVFKGTVRHKGARIPPGGKLVELQVRDGKFWNTVRQAFYTKPDGRYRLRYRFRADYTTNAKFHFRVKIVREQGWPYRAPVRTRARKVIVVAR